MYVPSSPCGVQINPPQINQEYAQLLQLIQRETFCVSVAVHQKDLGKTSLVQRSSVMPKKDDNVSEFLWDFMGLFGYLLGCNQQKKMKLLGFTFW